MASQVNMTITYRGVVSKKSIRQGAFDTQQSDIPAYLPVIPSARLLPKRRTARNLHGGCNTVLEDVLNVPKWDA